MEELPSPANTETIQGQDIRQYDIPEEGETVFNLDTTEKGYTLEWRVSEDYDLQAHYCFLNEINQFLEETSAEEGYLRKEGSGFSLEWEKWEDYNRVIFSGSEDSIDDLDEIFSEFYSRYQNILLGGEHSTLFENAKDIIMKELSETDPG